MHTRVPLKAGRRPRGRVYSASLGGLSGLLAACVLLVYIALANRPAKREGDLASAPAYIADHITKHSNSSARSFLPPRQYLVLFHP